MLGTTLPKTDLKRNIQRDFMINIAQTNLNLSSPILLSNNDNQSNPLLVPTTATNPTSSIRKPTISSLPPLNKLVRGWDILQDVSYMLDFAIIGFPKCGTSTMMNYLNTDELWVVKGEKCKMSWKKPAWFVEELYDASRSTYHNDTRIKRGTKCPMDMEKTHAHKLYLRYFNKTDFIIGVRHPVRWFESFYNFRTNQGTKLKPPNKFTNQAFTMDGVSSKRCRFHHYLSRLGKTPLSTKVEMKLVKMNPKNVVRTPAKIFLYDLEQLKDKNETRLDLFRDDLRRFLGVRSPLPKMIHTKPGKRWSSKKQRLVDGQKIDICKEEYKPIREKLMSFAIPASRWIRNYFLKSEDVFVSETSWFEEILRTWERDPCEDVLQ